MKCTARLGINSGTCAATSSLWPSGVFCHCHEQQVRDGHRAATLLQKPVHLGFLTSRGLCLMTRRTDIPEQPGSSCPASHKLTTSSALFQRASYEGLGSQGSHSCVRPSTKNSSKGILQSKCSVKMPHVRHTARWLQKQAQASFA